MWVIQFKSMSPLGEWMTIWQFGEYSRHGAAQLRFENIRTPAGFEGRIAYIGALGKVVEGGIS